MMTVVAVCIAFNIVIGVVNLWNLRRIRILKAEMQYLTGEAARLVRRRLDGRGV